MKNEKKSTGVGDTIEKITELTGVKALVHKLFGTECGCKERQDRLNIIFPYKMLDLNEEEFIYLHSFDFDKQVLTTDDQNNLLRIFNRCFNQNNKPSSCGSCWRSIVSNIRTLYNEYK